MDLAGLVGTDVKGDREDVLNRNTPRGRASSDVEIAVSILKAAFAVPLGNIQWDRLGGAKPLIASVTMKATQILCQSKRCRDVFDREAVNVQLVVVEDGAVMASPFEQEYEYREAEYEYDSMPELRNGN